MLNSLTHYFIQNYIPIVIGYLLGCISVWFIWRFFFHFVYQDDNTDKNIESLEKKVEIIANHLGVNNSKSSKEN
jgi:hypothetical protein